MFTGLQKEPKWGHLKDLHHALALSRKALLWGVPSKQKLGQDVEVVFLIKVSQYKVEGELTFYVADRHGSMSYLNIMCVPLSLQITIQGLINR